MMKKLCPNGHLQDISVMRCPECGASLRYAEEVPDNYMEPCPTAEPVPSSAGTERMNMPGQPGPSDGCARPGQAGNSNPPSEGVESCSCNPPDPHPVTGICKACELPVTASPAANGSKAEASTDSGKRTRSPYLVLPDGHAVPINAGVVVGRGAQFAGTDMANRLSVYKGVSRLHAWLGQDSDTLLLLDLGSRNGTWVNTSRLKPFSLTRLMLNSMPVQVRLGANLTLNLVEDGTA